MAISDPTDDRPPITAEDLDRIRARMLARANLGVDPGTPAFMDARMGSIYGDLEGPAALEVDEFYDFAEVVARATIPIDSFGEWLDDWAESLGLERKAEAPAGGTLRFAGTPGTVIASGFEVTTAAPIDADPTAFQVIAGGAIPGGGTLDLDAQAAVDGSAGNVSANTVTIPATDLPGLTSVTNPSPMTAGADVESDEQLRERVRDALAGDIGSGNQADYRRWLLNRPGYGYVTVRPVARGPGTVDIYATDVNNDPLPPAFIASEQAWLDPDPGQGLGQAPIGHDAKLLTPTGTGVTVAASGFTFAPGYSLDGAGGTRAAGPGMAASVARYVDGLGVGEDVVHNQVIRAMLDVKGAVDVDETTLTLNGTADTLAIAADHVAFTAAVNLT